MNKEENKVKRSTYMNKLFENRAEGRSLIWIDETNFNLYCKRSQGRSRIGTRASVVVPASKGSNLHCIGAMSSSALVLFTTRRGAFKANDCLQWFRDLVDACEGQGIHNPTFIIDNAPTHCRLENIIQEFPHVKLLRLAPYSYLLNPIELMWNIFKSHLKRMLQERMPRILNITHVPGLSMAEQRMRELEQIANESIAFITPNMSMGFSNRVERYYPMASREDLKELP
uniref:Tc1-like transposase DDE domain-containing protein n=1 Tax=Hirondellea gigas TaxID=1518452 RepID=A0A6A7FWY1_9CRUS